MDKLQASVGNRVVTVNAIHVDGKKLTLQFFRQIPKTDWLSSSLEPRQDMKIWGRAYYKIPGEGVEWLLVQIGPDLKRCNIDRPELSTLNLNFYQDRHEKAQARVVQLESELVTRQRELDDSVQKGNENLCKILVSSRDRIQAYMDKANADVAHMRTEFEKHQGLLARAKQRAKRFDELVDVEQIYIGSPS
jgi:hypothetical protein